MKNKILVGTEYEDTETRKGNPIASMRWRYQSYSKDTDDPYESDWEQFKDVAIRLAARALINDFNKFGKDDTVYKVFNEMNHKQPPIIITLQDAYKIIK